MTHSTKLKKVKRQVKLARVTQKGKKVEAPKKAKRVVSAVKKTQKKTKKVLVQPKALPVFDTQHIAQIAHETEIRIADKVHFLTENAKVREIAVQAGQFFVPKQTQQTFTPDIESVNVAVIIPTYRPNEMTSQLIESIIAYHPKAMIVVVDDCSPLDVDTAPTLSRINWLASLYNTIVVLRTPTNALKAGALNYGLSYLRDLPVKPDVVFTFDDDVIINAQTIPSMIKTLFASYRTGAVCSQVRVSNKNANLLTRLQGLEYHGFNITKISDNGFLKGPLVMQGMLTAFKMDVLEAVDGFTTNHLIEDYDITARAKIKGWEVRISKEADAWTEVPEKLEALWKQRARWTSGGLHVLADYWKAVPAVFQDMIGHASFLSLISLIILSFVFASNYAHSAVTPYIFALAITSFVLSLGYSIFVMKAYKDRDVMDWIVKLSMLPELIYSNLLSLVLFGSYAFYLFSALSKFILMILTKFISLILSAFGRVGYSSAWGTR